MSVNLRALIGKLDSTTRGVVEAAAGLCLSRTHYDVEIEHYLVKLLDVTDSDFAFIVRQYALDRSRLASDLAKSLDHLKTGNARTPAFSPQLARMLTEAWTIGSVDYGANQIRTGHTILALLADEDLSRMVKEVSREFTKIPLESLRKDLAAVTAHSVEEGQTQRGESAASSASPRAAGGQTPNLDAYTINLTDRAKQGKIDPVLGRDFEVRQVIDILLRRRQNNPILVGEAGVGKTAVVEGFALRIANGDVPSVLRNVTLRTLDLALLQAGAGVKGEFENRLKGLIEEVKNSPSPIILFIDEAHTMIGAGGAAGQNDAANLLKPALARGELRTLAATTWSEYKKYFEKDPALARRFQLVKVEEPSEEVCSQMMRGIVPSLETHHNVRIMDDGLEAAVRLSHRYLPDRQLPDKAVSVLDTACARLALGQNTTPPQIEAAQRRLEDLAVQRRVLEREAAVGANHNERLVNISQERAKTEAELATLASRWEKEKELVRQIREIRDKLEQQVAKRRRASAAMAAVTADAAPPDAAAAQQAVEDEARATASADQLRAELATLNDELAAVQGDAPLMRVCVDASLVGEVVSGWTGVPVGKMLRDDLAMVLELEKHLEQRVIGQNHALEYISRRVRTSRAGIEDPNKPKGVFMLVGPSGVGKTETALAISDLLYGGEQNLITINMSEFQEAHTVSTLKGSPPGYVGYGEGGVLTEAVRRRPYSVVLLDEIEKAHNDVFNVLLQVMDDGRLTDGQGRTVDFKNTVLIMTSNIPGGIEGVEAVLKPEFINRIDEIVEFQPLSREQLAEIVDLQLERLRARLAERDLSIELTDAAKEALAEAGWDPAYGARPLKRAIQRLLENPLALRLLEGGFAAGDAIRVDAHAGDLVFTKAGSSATAVA
jgi:type VI secretion system protein VasG